MEIKDYKIATKRKKRKGERKKKCPDSIDLLCVSEREKKSGRDVNYGREVEFTRRKKNIVWFLCKSKILYSSRTFYTIIYTLK